MLRGSNIQSVLRRLEQTCRDDCRIDVQMVNLLRRIVGSVRSSGSDFASVDTRTIHTQVLTAEGQILDGLQGSSMFQAFSRGTRLTFDSRRLDVF